MRRDLLTKWKRIEARREAIVAIVEASMRELTTEEVLERLPDSMQRTSRTILTDLLALCEQKRIRGRMREKGGWKRWWLWEAACKTSSGSGR